MNYKGGYRIIDFGGITLNSTAKTITGIYNRITKAGKPIVVKGVYDGASNYPIDIGIIIRDGNDIYIPVGYTNNGVVNKLVKITNADAVTMKTVT